MAVYQETSEGLKCIQQDVSLEQHLAEIALIRELSDSPCIKETLADLFKSPKEKEPK